MLLRIYWVLGFEDWSNVDLSSTLEKYQLLFLQTLNFLHSLCFVRELWVNVYWDPFSPASETRNLSFIFSIYLSPCAVFQSILSHLFLSSLILSGAVSYHLFNTCIKFLCKFLYVSVLEIMLGSLLNLSEHFWESLVSCLISNSLYFIGSQLIYFSWIYLSIHILYLIILLYMVSMGLIVLLISLILVYVCFSWFDWELMFLKTLFIGILKV